MGEFLKIENIEKRFGATLALDSVSFSVDRGEIRALLGENGAGKSTCVKVLNGLVAPDNGAVWLNDEFYAPRQLADAHKAGVSTAFQELSLMPDLSVAVNLCMPALPRSALGLVRFAAVSRDAERMLSAYNATDIDPSARVSTLSLADKQRLEIIRAFSRDPDLLILDEPTAALTDVTWLYEQIRSLTGKGAAVLFITHRLKEVRDLCERATVLRNGGVSGTVDLRETSDGELFTLMIGRAAASESSDRTESRGVYDQENRERPSALRVANLVCSSFGPSDLNVAAGEIVGVAGLEGQGQRSLFNALGGIESMTATSIEVSGQLVRIRSSISSRRTGIVFVPEERKEEGLFPGMETRANVSISSLAGLSRWGILSVERERQAIEEPCNAVTLDKRYYDMPIDQLSGGNQQKALIARALLAKAKCLLLFDPTRGVDVGTKESIYASMRLYAQKGVGVLFYSTELPELTALCDRCLVVYGNQITGECEGSDITEERLIGLMHGSSEAARTKEVV